MLDADNRPTRNSYEKLTPKIRTRNLHEIEHALFDALPRTPLGSLQRSLRPPSWFSWVLLLRKGGSGKGKEEEGKGKRMKKKGDGKGREGKGKAGGKSCPPTSEGWRRHCKFLERVKSHDFPARVSCASVIGLMRDYVLVVNFCIIIILLLL